MILAWASYVFRNSDMREEYGMMLVMLVRGVRRADIPSLAQSSDQSIRTLSGRSKFHG